VLCSSLGPVANWLEEEERDQAKRAALDAEEQRRRQQLAQKRATIDEAIAQRLNVFVALCERVNGVRAGSLLVDRLTVMSGRLDSRLADDAGVKHIVGHRRGIRFSCYAKGEENELPSSDRVVISAIVKQRDHFWSADDGDKYYEVDETILVRKECTHQDLATWSDDQILGVLKWLVLESDQDIGYLIPGSAFVTRAEAVAKLNCYVRIRLAKGDFRGPAVRIYIDGQVVGTLPQPSLGISREWDSAYQGYSQFKVEIGRHEVSARFGDLTNSITLQISAGQTMEYEIYQSSWTWSGSVRFRHLRSFN
jgi:hypothetical protein